MIDSLRQDFPILKRVINGKPLVYLDSAASAQKPRQVTNAMARMTENAYANVHRGLYTIANEATQAFEDARLRVRNFINAQKTEEIIFTSGATDAINLVASSYAAPRFRQGDEIILSLLEHHSNIVPWHFLRERLGVQIKWIPINDDGTLIMEAYQRLFSPRTRLVAVTQMSNALGVRTPLKAIIDHAHQHDVPVLVDGAQGVAHGQVDVQKLNCDFYAFSGHKLYGPNGIGVLYGRETILDSMPPYRGGGEMIREVKTDAVSYADLPYRFEAGTPPIVEAVGLHAAIDWLAAAGWDKIAQHEKNLHDYARRRLSEINAVRLLGSEQCSAAIIPFTMENAHPHDAATILDRSGIALRAGHHCAQPLMERLGLTASLRASFAVYNNRQDIDRLAHALQQTAGFFS